MYLTQYKQLIDVCDNISRKMVEPITQFMESFQSVLETIDIESITKNINEMLLLFQERIREFTEHLKAITAFHIEVLPSYIRAVNFKIPDAHIVESSPSRSPPYSNFKDRIEIRYIYLLPMFVRIILYLEGTIFSNYIYEILKYLLTFLGVYL